MEIFDPAKDGKNLLRTAGTKMQKTEKLIKMAKSTFIV